MNYEQYYQQGGTYVIPSEVFNELIEGYDAGVLATVEEVQRLEHNWNELKKYAKTQYLRADDESDYEIVFYMIAEKMQELEEGGNNE